MGKTGGMHGRSGDRDDGGDHDAEDRDESDDSDDDDDADTVSPFAGRSGVRGDEPCPKGAQEQGGCGKDAVRVRRSERLRSGWYCGEDAAEGTVWPERKTEH